MYNSILRSMGRILLIILFIACQPRNPKQEDNSQQTQATDNKKVQDSTSLQRMALVPKPKMARISGGTFLMGNNEFEDAQPSHKVNVPTFYLSETEVTIAQYCDFLNKTGKTSKSRPDTMAYNHWKWWFDRLGETTEWENRVVFPKSGKENLPVKVTWYAAKAYCEWLGEGYHLPSEAEWEYVAGGGATQRTTYPGTDSLSDLSAFIASGIYPPVASAQAVMVQGSPFYDLSGGVWEWCEDNWHDDYKGAPKDGSAWVEASDRSRMIRGGNEKHVSYRGYCPDIRYYKRGFRPARTF